MRQRNRLTRLLVFLVFFWLASASLSIGSAKESAVYTARIVFKAEDGRIIPVDKLNEVDGQVRYEIVSDQVIPTEAETLHGKGRSAGQQGDYKKALQMFEQAHKVAPDWPYPLYDAAFTHLLKGDSATAEQYYGRVDQMAPWGFFTAKTAADSLRREREGSLAKGAYLRLVMLEAEPSPATKRSILEDMVKDSPAFPAAWHQLANILEDPTERERAIEQGLKHKPDETTKGALLLGKAMLLSLQGQREQAAEILNSVAQDPDSTLENVALARIILLTNIQ